MSGAIVFNLYHEVDGILFCFFFFISEMMKGSFRGVEKCAQDHMGGE